MAGDGGIHVGSKRPSRYALGTLTISPLSTHEPAIELFLMGSWMGGVESATRLQSVPSRTCHIRKVMAYKETGAI